MLQRNEQYMRLIREHTQVSSLHLVAKVSHFLKHNQEFALFTPLLHPYTICRHGGCFFRESIDPSASSLGFMRPNDPN